MRARSLATASSRVLMAALLLFPAPSSAEWFTESPLPRNYVRTQAAASATHLYQLGGLGDKGVCGVQDVNVAPLAANGAVGAWAPTMPIPGLSDNTVTVTCAGVQYQMSEIVLGWGYQSLFTNGHLYVLGGNQRSFVGFEDGSTIRFSSTVFYARANADGSLGAWTRASDLPAQSFFGAAAESNGVLYMTGGRDDSSSSNASRAVYWSRLGADGAPGPWQTSAHLMPGGLSLHAAEVINGRLYVTGGMTWDPFPQNQITNGVFSAPLGADGAPGEWREESSLPTGLAAHGLHVRGGALLTIGGQEPVFPTVNVHSSIPNADGTLPGWTDLEPMPVPLFNHGSAHALERVYVAGGNDGSANQSGVYALRSADAPPSPNPAPSLAALSPDRAAVGAAGATVEAAGAGFTAGSAVRVGGTERPTTFVDASRLSFDLSAADLAAAGTLAVTVFTPAPGGGESSSVSFTVENPAPSLASLSPASGTEGSGAVTLLVDGANFVASSKVLFNGAQRETVFVSASRLAAELPASDLAAAGVASVSVRTPGPGGGDSSPTPFAVLRPAPSLAALSPSSALAGAAGAAVEAEGAGFTAASVVRVGGADRPTTFVDASRLGFSLSAADLAAAGTLDVAVFTPAPGGGTSASRSFTVENPRPSLSRLTPDSATAGSGAFTLVVEGADFAPGAAVRWDGADRPTTRESSALLRASIAGSDVSAAGSAAVTVVNPGPGGGASDPLTFTIRQPAPPPNPVPSISSLTPDEAVAGGAGLALTVRGDGFMAASVVRIGGEDRQTQLGSGGRLEAQLTADDLRAAGTLSVTVFNPAPGGGLSAAASFTVANPAPSAASLSPAGALAGSGALTLTVDGAGFVAGSVVRLDGAARETTFVSATRLAAALPASDLAAARSAAVTVASPAPGGGVSAARTFTISNPLPALVSLAPASAPVGASGARIVAHGSGFVAGTKLRWKGADRPTTFVSAAHLEAEIPASDLAAAGSAAVDVVSPAPGGGASSALSFLVTDAPARLAVTFAPATLNLKSSGGSFKALLAAGDASPADVDRETPAVTAVDGAAAGPVKAEEAKLKDEGLELRFDRQAVQALVTAGDRVLTISGRLKNGRAFSADGELRVLHDDSGKDEDKDKGKDEDKGGPKGVQSIAEGGVKHGGYAAKFWPAPDCLKALQIGASGDGLSATVSVKGRGKAVHHERVTVRVPEGAAPPELPITVSTTEADQAPDREVRRRETEKNGLVEVSAPAVFGPEGTVFAQPVTIELPYDPAALPQGFPEEKLKVHYWNPAASRWEELASTVDKGSRVVRAQTSHFSMYQVLAGAAASDDGFAVADAFVYPNPVRGGALALFRMQPGPGRSLEIRIYDLTGRVIHQAGSGHFRQFLDNGLDTYEHEWNTSGVGSGVYRWFMTARSADGKKAVRKGKVAVIK